MDTSNIIFNRKATLIIKRSKLLNLESNPAEDVVNWLFADIEGRHFSFLYQIIEPSKAFYSSPFKINLVFTMKEVVDEKININEYYDVYRGTEKVGKIKIIF